MVSTDAAAGGLGVRGAVVRYDDAPPAVAGVDLDVDRGEILALLGPSGCGKSSLLRAVAGLVPLAAGTVSWDGADMAGVPVHRRGFGLMFQDGQLFPHRDVAGNVAYGLEAQRFGRATRSRRVAELLELVGLAGYGDREVATLSGGQRQRVALARALAPQPRLLLLDEPLSSLDRGLRDHLAGELRDILTAAGATVVYVTHDHDEAMTVADRIAIMIAGRLAQVAAPDELWHRPGTIEVARFLGYGPLLPATVANGAARTIVGTVPLDDVRAAAPAGRGDALLLALGPRALSATSGTEAAVIARRFRRGRYELDVVLADGTRATASSAQAPSTDRVGLRIDPAHVALLPEETASDDRS